MRTVIAAALLPLIFLSILPGPAFSQDPGADSTGFRLDPLKFYGSVRIRYGVAQGGYTELADRFSRAGIRIPARIAAGWTAMTRLEFGLNIVNQNPLFIAGGDDGFSYGQGSMPVTTRLGYVEVASPYGTLSVGKQWGIYYDIAGWTDNFPTFGGTSVGAYPTGDGGIQGTGRAEKAIQYRLTLGPVGLGLQSQARNYSPENKHVLNTWAAKIECALPLHLTLGGAYNEVRDGVPDPSPEQPKEGDKALIVGLKYDIGHVFVAVNYAHSSNHEVDDQGAYFDGDGAEAYLHYDLDAASRWFVYGGFNYLTPTDTEVSKYRLLYGLGGVAWRLTGAAPGPLAAAGNTTLSFEVRIDGSRYASGSAMKRSMAVLGINVGW